MLGETLLIVGISVILAGLLGLPPRSQRNKQTLAHNNQKK